MSRAMVSAFRSLRCNRVFSSRFASSDDKVGISSDELKALDETLSGLITEILDGGDFKGKKGNSATLRHGGSARYVSLISSGTPEQATSTWGPGSYQSVGATIGAACKANKAKLAAVTFIGSTPDAQAVEGLTYGTLTASHECTRFKAEAKPSVLEKLQLLLDAGSPDLEKSRDRGCALARGNLYARYLVEAPPNVCTPAYLAKSAVAIAEKFPEVMSCKVLEKSDCEDMGMGCYLGVAACSDLPPKFIHLTYTPRGGASKKIALVGKGLTFDSGGYNIKAGPGSMIELMKLDMGGAGAVFGAARAIAEMEPAGVEIHFISASCENMIDGKGMRPGDILVSSSGKTVEVGNTDAEGRLTLADALWYAQEKVGAESVIDIATLTGAQMIALGNQIGAVLTPSDDMQGAISQAGCDTGGEKWWRLPLDDAYWEMMKSPCADFKNIGGRLAGVITAGLFLKQFVDPKKIEWAHLDIAGPAWDDKQGGATGFGATSLACWAAAQEGHSRGAVGTVKMSAYDLIPRTVMDHVNVLGALYRLPVLKEAEGCAIVTSDRDGTKR